MRTHTATYTRARVDREIKALKRAAAINQLAALRATAPDPPMVSVLDQQEDQAQQPDPEAGVSMCMNRTCVNARLRVRELERELLDVRSVSERRIHSNYAFFPWSIYFNKLQCH